MPGISGLGALRRVQPKKKGGLAYAGGGDVYEPGGYDFAPDGALEIGISGGNQSDELPHEDIPDSHVSLVDLTRGNTNAAINGATSLDAERSKLPPDPVDSLHNADSALLDPSHFLGQAEDQLMRSRSNVEDALANAHAGQDRARQELLAMRGHQFRGNPWLQFAGAVMQPSSSPMSSVGKAVAAFGNAKDALSRQDMGIDELLGKTDTANANTDFNQRLQAEEMGMKGVGTMSQLAGVGMKMWLMRIRQQLMDRMLNGAPGANGAQGAPGASAAAGGAGDGSGGYNGVTPQFASAMEVMGLPGAKIFAMNNPEAKFIDTGNALLPVNPITRKPIGAPIPKNLSPDQAATLAQKNAEFKANTGVDLTNLEGSGAPRAAAGNGQQPPASAPTSQQSPDQSSSAPGESQGFNANEPSPTDVAKNVDQYIAGQKLPAVAAQKTRAQLIENQQKNLDATRQAVDSTNAVVKRVDDIINKVSQHSIKTTGALGEALSKVPGTTAHDVAKQLDTIQHQMMGDAINSLRASSPTGALNMRITEQEIQQLQSRVASPALTQSPKQFLDNMRDIRDHFLQMQGRARQNYERVYGKTPDASIGAQKFYTTEAEAEAAAKRGEIHDGDTIIVGGRTARWHD